MPTFGDYETVGEPVSTRELNSGVAIVWRAGKTGNGGSREYAVKCFVPRRSAEAAVREGALEADRGLEFLENIKQLKRIQGPEARLFAPIHGIGTSEDGAWYATDFCRRDLKSHIILRGGVDAQGLRHVCYSLVSGCLALQRACGRSHANLKASNVLLPGPPRPLRHAPVQLVDPRPASLFSSPRLEHADRQDLGELIRDISEVQDLHAIGLIILQLVKGRLFQSSYDYDYPVAPSAEWEKLGSERGRWRELCNRLLDPGLSPAEINLASLAKEFQPGAMAGKLPLIGAVAGVMVLAGVGGYAAWHTIEASNHRKMAEWAEDKKKLEADLAAGNEQLAQSNYSGAVASFKEAARRAGNLKDPREQEATNGLNCASWLKQAVEAHGNDDELPDEIKWLEAAEAVRQSSAGGEMLKAARGRAGALFTNEMNTGKSFVPKENYGGASEHYGHAAKWAAMINNEGGRQQAEKEESYAKALDEAEKEESGGNFSEAAKAWQRALDLKPEDAFAKQGLDGSLANERFTQLLDQAEKAISPKTIPAAWGSLKQAGDLASAHRIAPKLLEREAKLKSRISEEENSEKTTLSQTLAQAATYLDSADYPGALREFQAALDREPNNEEAIAGNNFARWMEEGVGFKQKAEYENASSRFSQALSRRAGDKKATAYNKFCAAMIQGEQNLKGGQFDQAKKSFQEASDYDGQDANASGALTVAESILAGDEHYAKGEFASAANAYATAKNSGRYGFYANHRHDMAQARAAAEKLLNDGNYGADAQGKLKEAAELEKELRISFASGVTPSITLATFAFYVAAGDSSLAKNDNNGAKTNYENAAGFLPEDKYLRRQQRRLNDRIAEEQKELAAKEKKLHQEQEVQAMTTGWAAFDESKFAGASTEFGSAISLASGLGEAGAEQEAAAAKKLADALAQVKLEMTQGNYSQAYTSAVQEASASPPAHAQAIQRVASDAAFHAAVQMQKENPDEALRWLKKALDADQGNEKAKTLKSEIENANAVELSSAKQAFDQGEYDSARNFCDRHPSHPEFNNLAAQVAAETNALADARRALTNGEYPYLNAHFNQYRNKPPFLKILTQGADESTSLNTLQGLTNNWNRLNNALNNTSPERLAKKPFAELVKWRNDNDPVKLLDNRLELFKVWFELRKPDPSIIDFFTHKEARPLDSRTILTTYRELLGKLRADYKANPNAASRLEQIKKDLDAIEGQMDDLGR